MRRAKSRTYGAAAGFVAWCVRVHTRRCVSQTNPAAGSGALTAEGERALWPKTVRIGMGVMLQSKVPSMYAVVGPMGPKKMLAKFSMRTVYVVPATTDLLSVPWVFGAKSCSCWGWPAP